MFPHRKKSKGVILVREWGQGIGQPPDIYLMSGKCFNMTLNEENEGKK